MNIRRTVTAVASTAALVTSLTVGIAAPASAAPAPIVIPKCAQILSNPSTYFESFATANGAPAVYYRPSPVKYGTANSTLKNFLVKWKAKNCSWHVDKKTSRNFTISEVALTPARYAQLQRWMAARGIVGTDVEATMGGILYVVSDTEWSLLMHGKVWVTIKARGTSVFGYTMQAASYTLYDYNPTL